MVASMRRLTLVEHQTAHAVQLTRAQRAALQGAVPEIAISPGVRAGCFDVTPGAWVGVVALDGLAVEIRPKLPLRNVLFLASYAAGSDVWRDTRVDLAEQDSLVELVASLFATHVRRALAVGLLQGYRTEDAALPTVRGRLRFDQQVRSRFGQFPPAEVRYDVLTEDIVENRLLKAALVHLLGVSLRSPDTVATLRRLLSRFERVEPWRSHRAGVPTVAYSPLNRRYRPALELARLILRDASLDLGAGSAPGACFLLDMDRVFEDFITTALRDALDLSVRAFPHGCAGRKLTLDAASSLPLLPDLSWWEDGRCVFAGDVKYKRTRHGEQADLYQVLAYSTAAGLPAGLLVYAAGPDHLAATYGMPGQLAVHEVPHAGNTGKALHVTALDLNGSPSDILAQVALLAQRVRRLRLAVRDHAVA